MVRKVQARREQMTRDVDGDLRGLGRLHEGEPQTVLFVEHENADELTRCVKKHGLSLQVYQNYTFIEDRTGLTGNESSKQQAIKLFVLNLELLGSKNTHRSCLFEIQHLRHIMEFATHPEKATTVDSEYLARFGHPVTPNTSLVLAEFLKQNERCGIQDRVVGYLHGAGVPISTKANNGLCILKQSDLGALLSHLISNNSNGKKKMAQGGG